MMAFTDTPAPAGQFGDGNQAFGYMAILQAIYFVHRFSSNQHISVGRFIR